MPIMLSRFVSQFQVFSRTCLRTFPQSWTSAAVQCREAAAEAGHRRRAERAATLGLPYPKPKAKPAAGRPSRRQAHQLALYQNLEGTRSLDGVSADMPPLRGQLRRNRGLLLSSGERKMESG